MSWLFSQALVAEYSAAKCSAGVPFAPLNLTPMPQGLCSADKMTAVSKLSRFGMTFAPLTAGHGAELLMWFLEDSRARILARPVKALASTVKNRDSGLNSLASLARYDPNLCLWKTPQPSIFEDSAECSVIWPRSGLMLDGVCWQQAALAPAINGSGPGLLPTPVASMAEKSSPNQRDSNGRPGLQMAAMMWPTPVAHDDGKTPEAHMRMKANMPGGPRYKCTSLTVMVKGIDQGLFHTPRANDAEKRGNLGDDPRNGLPAQVQHLPPALWRTPDANMASGGASNANDRKEQGHAIGLADQVNTPGGQLNPDWVEWLMGWPIGWTRLEPLANAAIVPWDQEPADLPRVGRNIPARAVRLRAIGNGQVPLCAAMAFLMLFEQLTGERA